MFVATALYTGDKDVSRCFVSYICMYVLLALEVKAFYETEIEEKFPLLLVVMENGQLALLPFVCVCV